MSSNTLVLVVDDSKVSRMMIRNFIAARHADWEIAEAASGEEALAFAAERAPDMVTLDVNMTGISGFEAAKELRRVCPAARIVLVTANVQESTRRKATSLGVGFVPKPITAASVDKALEYFLNPGF